MFKRLILKVVLIVLAIAISTFILTKIIKIEPYKKAENNNAQFDESAPYVSLDIECAGLYTDENYAKLSEGIKNSGMLPDDGFFLKDEKLNLQNKDSLLAIIERACAENDISLDYSSADENPYKTAYIKGVGGLYEGDCGKNSGWVYEINGEQPEVGVDKYNPIDGDEIVLSFVVF